MSTGISTPPKMSGSHGMHLRRLMLAAWISVGLTALMFVIEFIYGQGPLELITLLLGMLVFTTSAVVLILASRVPSVTSLTDKTYSRLFEDHPQAVLLTDRTTHAIISANQEACRRYGYNKEEFATLRTGDLLQSGIANRVRPDYATAAEKLGTNCTNEVHLAKGGATFTAQVTSALLEIDGRPLQMSIVTDISERDEALAEAQESSARYHQLMDTAKEGIITVDVDMAIAGGNQPAADLLGYSIGDLVGRPIAEFYGPEGAELEEADAVQRAAGELAGEREMTLRDKDGLLVPVLVSESPLLDREGAYAGQLGMITDLTERKGFEDELNFQALHDPLSGLPNRILLAERLQSALGRCARGTPGVAAVFVDIDEFKAINATHGHKGGDNLLIEIARRLSGCVVERDTVARFGGNEFVVVSEGTGEFAETLARSVREAMAIPYLVGDVLVNFTVSIGVAMGYYGDRPGAVLRNADTALMQAKSQGKNRTEFFTQALRTASRQRLSVASDLRHALERGEFSLRFQPVVLLSDTTIIGAEALIRWEHPKRGTLAPAEFIPIAEENGLIAPIGRWVIEETIRQFMPWQVVMPDLMMSINISASQLGEGDLDEVLGKAIIETGIDSSHLALEVTESVLMEDVELSCRALKALRQTGAMISIDDFGTGYSSLSYLNRFPIDILKIDQTFVAGLPDHAYDIALVEAVLALADALNLTVIAEGVENEAQANSLKSLGCHKAQGYLFSRPLTATDFEAALRATLPA